MNLENIDSTTSQLQLAPAAHRQIAAELKRAALALNDRALWHIQQADEARSSVNGNARPLSDLSLEAAKVIDSHPGLTGQEIADRIGCSHDHLRGYCMKRLKQHGYYNHPGNCGYYPPAPSE